MCYAVDQRGDAEFSADFLGWEIATAPLHRPESMLPNFPRTIDLAQRPRKERLFFFSNREDRPVHSPV